MMTAEDLVLYAKTYCSVLGILALAFLAIWSRRVKPRWLRWSFRASGAVALIWGSFALFLLLLIPRFASISALASPDGRHICYVSGGGSGMTVDWTSITVRSAWRPFAQEVYFTEGGFDPQVRWRDARTLVIRYPVRDDPEFCRHSLPGIDIQCEPAPRKEFYPLEASE